MRTLERPGRTRLLRLWAASSVPDCCRPPWHPTALAPTGPRGSYGPEYTNVLKAANAEYVDVFMSDYNWVCGIASDGSVVCPTGYDMVQPAGTTSADLTALGGVTSIVGYQDRWRCAIAGGAGRCWGSWASDYQSLVPAGLGPVVALGNGFNDYVCWITGAASGPSGELLGVEWLGCRSAGYWLAAGFQAVQGLRHSLMHPSAASLTPSMLCRPQSITNRHPTPCALAQRPMPSDPRHGPVKRTQRTAPTAMAAAAVTSAAHIAPTAPGASGLRSALQLPPTGTSRPPPVQPHVLSVSHRFFVAHALLRGGGVRPKFGGATQVGESPTCRSFT